MKNLNDFQVEELEQRLEMSNWNNAYWADNYAFFKALIGR